MKIGAFSDFVLPLVEHAAVDSLSVLIYQVTVMGSKVIALVAVLAVCVIGGGAFWLLKQKPVDDPSLRFVQMEEFVVNLKATDRRFLRIKVSLELEKSVDRERVEANMPKIRDICGLYFYGLRLEELEGSRFAYALKEELNMRINKVIHPAKVKNVLINQLLAS